LKRTLFWCVLGPAFVVIFVWKEGGWLMRSGLVSDRIERAIDERWEPGGLPKGLVHVGGVEVVSYDTVLVHDIVLGEPGQRPLATIDSARARLYLLDPGLSDLTLDGLDVRLDQSSYGLLNRVIHAEHERKSTGEHQWTNVVVTGATVRVASGATFTQVQAFSRSYGPLADVLVNARYAGRDITLKAKTARQSDQSLALSIDFRHFQGPLAPLIDAGVCIGELPPPPLFLRAYLPAVVDATHTTVTRNLGNDAWDGDLDITWAGDAPGLPPPGVRVGDDGTAAPWDSAAAGATAAAVAAGSATAPADAAPALAATDAAAALATATGAADAPGDQAAHPDADADLAANGEAWPGGGRCGLKAHLTADPQRLQLTKLTLVDPTVVDGVGSFDADLDHDDLHVVFSAWHPGPRLLIPDAVPVPAILAVLPQVDFHAHVSDPVKLQARLTATGTARSLADIAWEPGKPVVISGSDLPLTLAQPFLPAAMTVVGGQGASMSMIIDDGLKEVTVDAVQGRVAAYGWTFGPVDAHLKVVPGAVSGVAIDVVLPNTTGGAPMGTGAWKGPPEAAHIDIAVRRVQDLLAFVHGPYPELPDLSGAAELSLDLDLDPKAISGTVRRLRLEHLNHRGSQHEDSLRDLTTTVRGRYAWKDDRLVADFGGQIESGDLRIPGTWLPLAARTPLYTCAFAFTPPRGFAPAGIDIDEIMVVAATKAGEPMPGGYSAQLSGSLTADGTGELAGVVDHADLAWVNGLLPLDPGSMSGQGAIDVSADLVSADVQRVAGSFLPLNADLHLGGGFHATGITGAVRFEMARP
jgi:hypothetical protein